MSPFSGRKKPSNYRERLLYVNLKPQGPAIITYQASNSQDLRITATCDGFDLLLDFRRI